MELKPGCKMTEVGVIPEDWEVKQLKEIAEVTSGKRLPAGYSLVKDKTPHPYIRVSDMYPGGISMDNIMYVPVNIATYIKNYRIYIEDIFISVAGTLGIVGQIPKELNGSNLTENADKITKITCYDKFLVYILLSDIIQKVIATTRTIGAQPKLALDRIRNFFIPLPPALSEQQAIAAALSDVDELLSSLDQLIAKKKDIRLATMHELLTGKTRLPGFQEKWREKSVDEVSELGHKRIVPYKTPHCHMCIELEHIVPKTGKLCGFSDGKFISSIKSFFDEQSILFGKLRAYLQKFWYAKCSGACSTEIWVLNAKRNIVVPKFLYYAIQTKEFIEASSITYGTHMPRSDWNMVKDVILSLPPSLAEQQAIAAVLSDMDTEIEALEARRDKVRHIKAGMMQDLLTGNTRLISSGEGA